jgi:RluA family pseudouridine synthase
VNDFPIIFEDDYFLAIAKPAGVVVNDALTVADPTVQQWSAKRHHTMIEQVEIDIKAHVFQAHPDQPYDKRKEFVDRAGIVHRLDKETSGILLIAKTVEAFRNLQEQFAQRKTEKEYVALVHGVMPAIEGEIRLPIGRLPWDKQKFGVTPDGKDSLTLYRVEATYHDSSADTYSLLALQPKTGRTHQLRVHLKHLNHNIVSDYLYGGHKRAKADRIFLFQNFFTCQKNSFYPSDFAKTDGARICFASRFARSIR